VLYIIRTIYSVVIDRWQKKKLSPAQDDIIPYKFIEIRILSDNVAMQTRNRKKILIFNEAVGSFYKRETIQQTDPKFILLHSQCEQPAQTCSEAPSWSQLWLVLHCLASPSSSDVTVTTTLLRACPRGRFVYCRCRVNKKPIVGTIDAAIESVFLQQRRRRLSSGLSHLFVPASEDK